MSLQTGPLTCLLGSIFILVATFSPTSGQSGYRGSSGRRQVAICQKMSSSTGREYLLDPDSGQCYLLGSQGPCGELMTFYRHPTTPNTGFCDCEQGHIDLEKPCADAPIRKRIYYPKDSRCYTAFSPGPCQSKEWWVLNEGTGSGVCVPNPCLAHGSSGSSREREEQFWYYDPQKRSCYKSFTQGPCPSGSHLELRHDSQYPECRVPSCLGAVSWGIIRSPSLTCGAGSRLSYLTRSCRGLYGRFRTIG